ncbi:uncharacterized protein LOC135686059 [Rhopilema esculentum]|uniref:uncharacterized protein LOC135686059 n=1 Tax=Rhopilema esculentum TaxID=499914 RepID=UPI0031D9FC16
MIQEMQEEDEKFVPVQDRSQLENPQNTGAGRETGSEEENIAELKESFPVNDQHSQLIVEHFETDAVPGEAAGVTASDLIKEEPVKKGSSKVPFYPYKQESKQAQQGTYGGCQETGRSRRNRVIVVQSYGSSAGARNEIYGRPMASYSRHLVGEVKRNEQFMNQSINGMQEHGNLTQDPLRPGYGTRGLQLGGNSLMLARSYEDAWRNMRGLTSPTEPDEFAFSDCTNLSAPTTPNFEVASMSSSQCSPRVLPAQGVTNFHPTHAFANDNDYIFEEEGEEENEDSEVNDEVSDTDDMSEVAQPAVYEQVGNVRRITVQPANESSYGMLEALQCHHGKRKSFCTLCTRPTGRVGREFKAQQDNFKREREEKKRKMVRFE